jgi:hypothetical protein
MLFRITPWRTLMTFDVLLSSHHPDVQLIARAAVTLVSARWPDVPPISDFAGKQISYYLVPGMKGWLVSIAPYKAYVNLNFADGAHLTDTAGLLHGTGKNVRHVRLNSAADLLHEAIPALLDQQMQITRARVKI